MIKMMRLEVICRLAQGSIENRSEVSDSLQDACGGVFQLWDYAYGADRSSPSRKACFIRGTYIALNKRPQSSPSQSRG
jgi:hypothetical protein